VLSFTTVVNYVLRQKFDLLNRDHIMNVDHSVRNKSANSLLIFFHFIFIVKIILVNFSCDIKNKDK